jgi:hypothetical protein
MLVHIHTDPLVMQRLSALERTIKDNQKTILQLLERIMATETEVLDQLSAANALLTTIQTNLAEALNELTGFPATVSALQASVDALTAELAAATPGTVSQALLDAATGVSTALVAVQESAANLANIVPNPTV